MLSVGIALLVATAAAPADEPIRRETETGSRLAKRAMTNVWDDEKTRKVQAAYGECVIKKQSAAAQQFVLNPNMDKAEWRKAIDKVADGYCLSVVTTTVADVEMKFPVDTMRYALADALVRKEFAAGPAAGIKDAAPLELPKLNEADYQLEPWKKPKKGQLEELKVARQKQVTLIYMAAFGECVVRADPANSYALLMSEPTSPQESALLKTMMPAFGGCVVTGQSLSFNKAILRGAIALNYYRLAHAPRVTTASAGATK